MPQQFWLLKSEPSSYSIDDFVKSGETFWEGVRNYQARNLMRDAMQPGDLFLFYHSSAEPAGVAGIGKILDPRCLDRLALDKNSDYFDPKASQENNPWFAPRVKFVAKFPRLVSLEELKQNSKLKNMMVTKRGMRLSVQPLTKTEFDEVCKMASE